MAASRDRTSADADATSARSSLPPASLSGSLNEKADLKEAVIATNDDAVNTPEAVYPEGWKLWIVYVATLLTMFLVGRYPWLDSAWLDC